MTHFATSAIHADDQNNRVPDVAPPINVSVTYRYDNDNLKICDEKECLEEMDSVPVYSRTAHPNCTRLESVLSSILNGHAVVYNSGCSAFYAALVHYNPKRLFIEESYDGMHAIADIMTRNYGMQQHTFDNIEKYAQVGDIVHLESPLNPYGISSDIQALADRAHAKGALLMVDSTLAPPPLQNTWDFGPDIIMHSATKYFGGHSDLLAGILVTKDKDVSIQLKGDRIYLGTIPGNLESFLLLRSLRTMEMRVLKQSENATKIVQYLVDNKETFDKVLGEIYHSSLQDEPFVAAQMSGGYTPLFSFKLQTIDQAKHFPEKLKIFQHATSLGGIESLIEWRVLSEPELDQTLLRISVGCENVDDLIADLQNALQQAQKEEA
ncbi:uncharacterized protein KNAG_0F01580 [Huiozyma naganishii CBS 8797]|uniref:Cystathionine gamma-synthase n=1 Tax=Huiozyma naganishii (strain ATCC MYA-139 / BCRC 22969 / CBS 8797 / KCTC 17520 / NBRC 10181 / NCYC 3082 / Yp74L-3) TaxID=1071383 RepID=J7S8B5_HUIN7|nr:hypothetical protein KNAG_0F01580 [Kazachstania naganishii CBS 8797]CCK70826.1 hypothetical protein KNAG_0F01580 [Kazachstania naganishii CBS 8797]